MRHTEPGHVPTEPSLDLCIEHWAEVQAFVSLRFFEVAILPLAACALDCSGLGQGLCKLTVRVRQLSWSLDRCNQ